MTWESVWNENEWNYTTVRPVELFSRVFFKVSEINMIFYTIPLSMDIVKRILEAGRERVLKWEYLITDLKGAKT